MRLMFLLQGHRPEDQIGYHDAFASLLQEGGLDGYLPLPWRGLAADQGWEAFCEVVIQRAREFEPDAVFFQFFHAPSAGALTGLLEALRDLSSRPVLALSGGDALAWHRWMPGCFPSGFLAVAKAADVTFVTAMGKCADFLARQQVKNISLLPLGACQVRFRAGKITLPQERPEFDVVFVGRNCRARDPRSFLFYYGLKRRRLIKVLHRRYGSRLGVFGAGWEGHPCWHGPVAYAEQLSVCRRSRVVFGGAPGIYQDYYASDRPFIQGLSRVPLVDWQVPRIDKLMRNGEHWHLVTDEQSMIGSIDRLLAMDSRKVAAMTDAAVGHIQAHLTQETMMRFLADTLRKIITARRAGRAAPVPEFPFFLPEVNLEAERQHALRHWVG